MRVLILSCNTGGGHNACAYALKEIFDKTGDFCEVKDSLSFVSNKFSFFMEKGHNAMYRYFPWFFRLGYGLCERHPEFFEEQGCIYKILKIGMERLYQYIEENDYKVIIGTHVFSALMISAVQRKYRLNIRTYFVATDYTCSPGVKESLLDYYFIPHEALKEEFREAQILDEKIICSGIPVSRSFYKKEVSKGTDRLPVHLLIMCGSMGCGPLLPIIERLKVHIDSSHRVTVVCGNNEKLKKRLEKLAGANKQFQIKGFVENMGTLLDSADLYMTKPGGLSTTEAVNKGIPMVFVNAVAGCEAYNRDFFVQHGCAVSEDSLDTLVRTSINLLNDEKRRIEMMEHCQSVSNGNSSRLIVDYIRRVSDEDRKTVCGL